MGRPADQISFREIVEVIHGPYFLAKCFNVEEICDRPDCPIQYLLEKAQDALLEVFEKYTIADLLRWQKAGKPA